MPGKAVPSEAVPSEAAPNKVTPGRGGLGASGPSRLNQLFSAIARVTSREAGRAWVFVLAFAVVATWALSGPLFGFSDTWQLVINTGTTIVTFLMVFLIQNSQNRDSAAIQVKLDELIRVSRVKNVFIGIEHLTDEELDEIRSKCETRAHQGAGLEPRRRDVGGQSTAA